MVGTGVGAEVVGTKVGALVGAGGPDVQAVRPCAVRGAVSNPTAQLQKIEILGRDPDIVHTDGLDAIENTDNGNNVDGSFVLANCAVNTPSATLRSFKGVW